MNDDCDYVFRVLLVGESGVGKSALMHRCTHSSFEPTSSASTVGVDFGVHRLELDMAHGIGGGSRHVRVKLRLYDSAGSERFRSIVSSYFRGAEGALLVYDLTSADSFRALRQWARDLDHYGGPPSGADLALVVVGNKLDLAPTERAIDAETAAAYACQLPGAAGAFDVSARSGHGVGAAFEALARRLVEARDAAGPPARRFTGSSALQITSESKRPSSRCCS